MRSQPTKGARAPQQEAWSREPLKASPGGNFTTHRLTAPAPELRIFRATRQFQGFLAGIALIPLLIGAFMAPANPWVLLAPLPFILGAAYGFFSIGKPVVFDRASSVWYKGRKPPQGAPALEDIAGLQLLQKWMAASGTPEEGGGGIYPSFQLNALLRDGRRENIVTGGHKTEIINDGRALAAFLGVSLEDHTPRWG